MPGGIYGVLSIYGVLTGPNKNITCVIIESLKLFCYNKKMQLTGMRKRKKERMRQQIADAAAELFAVSGFDEVAISDVAKAADVSEQTVYNYFPAKQDLVLDRAEEIRKGYYQAIVERRDATSPALALRDLARKDVERHRRTNLGQARGQFPAMCSSSPNLRRFALEARDQQAETVASAITATCPAIHPAIARSHASALISVFQMFTDHIGRSVLAGAPPAAVADELAPMIEIAFNDLDAHFHALVSQQSGNAQDQSSS